MIQNSCTAKKIFGIVVTTSILFITCTETLAPFLISDSDEVQLGKEFRAQIKADSATYPPYHGNRRVGRYIDSLGQLLADAQDDRDTLSFTFTVIDKPDDINAFAIPGGHIFIYTGLLLNAQSGAEVAGVLAHEIGHITKYHGRNLLLQNKAVEYVNAILFGDSSSIAGAVAGLLENMVFLKFSRNNEFQADSCAAAYSTLAGINPVGISIFLKALRDKYGEQPEVFEPFSTHPPLTERLESVETVVDTLNGAAMGSNNMFTEEFLEIRSLL